MSNLASGTPPAISVPGYAGGAILLAGSAAAMLFLVLEQVVGLNLPGCGIAGGCAQATESIWGRVPGVDWPVSFVGLAYFVFMGVWYAVAGGRRVPLHAALCALPASLGLVGLMATGAAPWCTACLAVHVVNVVLVVAAWRLAAAAPRESASYGLNNAVTAAAVAMVMVGGLWFHYRSEVSHRQTRAGLLQYRHLVTALQEDPEFLLREHAAQPQYEFALRPTEAARADAHQLVVFTDFACEACFCNAVKIQDEIVKTFDGRLDVLVRYLPMKAPGAAQAAEAARQLGGEEAFSEMYRQLFLHRDQLGPALYKGLASEIGLDPDALLYEMNSPSVCEVVTGDLHLAHRLGVDATPTMFLDGRRVMEMFRTPLFWDAHAAARTNQPTLAIRK